MRSSKKKAPLRLKLALNERNTFTDVSEVNDLINNFHVVSLKENVPQLNLQKFSEKCKIVTYAIKYHADLIVTYSIISLFYRLNISFKL